MITMDPIYHEVSYSETFAARSKQVPLYVYL